ncbi:flagellar operon protein [Herbinix hemicellulosilytica]|uniref:Flagellar operon protein n=1 Tax=Herbinix hemicellulosilytica TaxID=1564487 RepID=A0A0H5SHM5_HERHM|nr:TIGR02530 family flagellar biosynthesis protein [Herbinix hemicellulosilytica]RBP60865.1 flagellar operon protein [Herbinix hemicellulosilytica]CRZ34560.1 hypothetical protein HHT355_1359 [Herbinix hemicellulosilytica]
MNNIPINNIPIGKIPSVMPVGPLNGSDRAKKGNLHTPGKPFDEILKEKQASLNQTQITELKFSKHANERLASRNIDLTDEQYERLLNGARKASEKGIRESLVLIDDLAFIVNIKNSTVITAVNEGEEKIFTNIDGAVIM